MTFTVSDLKAAVESLHNVATVGLNSLLEECDEYEDWLNSVKDAVTRGDLAKVGLLPKTPAKKHGVLGTINESFNSTSHQDTPPEFRTFETEPKKPGKKSKRPQGKRKQDLSSDEEETILNDNDSFSKRRRTADKNTKLPVSQTNDANDTKNISHSEVEENHRLTRTRVQRTTFVKTTVETVVIEKRDEAAESSRLPVRSPSQISTVTPDPVSKLKPVRQLKQRVPIDPETPPMEVEEVSRPPLRMTRTKTRAMAKAAQKEPPKSPPAEKSPGNESEVDSESATTSIGSVNWAGTSNTAKQKFGTPMGKSGFLSHSQLLGTPMGSNIVTGMHSFLTKPAPASVKKDRQEDYLLKITQKGNEAVKKREELIKAQTEEKIKKRQEKVSKVNAAREALERERAEKLRQQMAAEEEKQKQEAKRRKLAQQKAAEAAEAAKIAKRLQEEENRRLAEERKRELEEQRRLAEEKKREQEQMRLAEERKREEEERRRLAEEKRKEQEEKKKEQEKKRLMEKKRQLEEQKRLAEERKKVQEETELRKMEAEKAVAMKAKAALASAKQQLNETFVKPLDETYVKPADETFVQPSPSYVMTPLPENRKPAPSKSLDDYGIDDAGCDDSSEDESNPKKEIPFWAIGKTRMPHLMSQYYVRHRQGALFFGSKKSSPDLSKIFQTIDRKMLIRKSSAVWRTPPVKFNDSAM